MSKSLRNKLVKAALAWQDRYGVAPSITSAISEYDAACLVGCSEDDFAESGLIRTAVTKGYDFEFGGKRYQVKANRPSGKPGSRVTLVAKAKNYDWDHLVWILYDRFYTIVEAWMWDVDSYWRILHEKARITPEDMRLGTRLENKSQVASSPGPDFIDWIMAGVLDVLSTKEPTVRPTKGERRSQQEVMREIFKACDGDKDRAITEYARAEEEGRVTRRSNVQRMSALKYARRLLYDGEKKGWLKH